MEKAQITSTIMMVRPVAFRMNEQTAVNNHYQQQGEGNAQEAALEEFDQFVAKLREYGVNVIVIQDTEEPNTPDSIFPNNWISFHEDGRVILYPMFAENRRAERRLEILDELKAQGLQINEINDYSEHEEEDRFLEGTGSIILDRPNGLAYCALSDRADEELFRKYCEEQKYEPVVFHAYQSVGEERKLIYHTNVMMCIGLDFAVICLNSIDDQQERKHVVQQLEQSGKEIIDISEEQVNQFAGNMLQVKANEEPLLVMSQSAFDSLSDDQRNRLEAKTKILSSSLSTIEKNGGGSARCMMAEVFLGTV